MGSDTETLAALRARLGEDLPRDGRSIGRENVHRRIHLDCGMGYELVVESTPGEGAWPCACPPGASPRPRDGGAEHHWLGITMCRA